MRTFAPAVSPANRAPVRVTVRDRRRAWVARGLGLALLVATAATRPNDAAYELLHERVFKVRESFIVYEDGDSGFNHGQPSGFFGDIEAITLDAFCVHDQSSPTGCSDGSVNLDIERGNVLRIAFAPLDAGSFARGAH